MTKMQGVYLRFMHPIPSKIGSTETPLIVRHSVSEQVLSEMRRRILHGDFPAGKLLPESHCAALLSVSRVPVREALMALEKEGLIVRDARGRTVVRTFKLRDYNEIVSLRLELEGMAARLAATHRTDAQLEALTQNIEAFARAQSAEELAQKDVDFHGLIIQASSHQWLYHSWSTICSPYQWLLTRNFRSYIAATSLEESKVSTLDHTRILEAIRLQKTEDAELLMRQHIRRWTEWTPPLD
jgi:DNA-binding GntR family transcriptional regulator